MFFPFCLVHPLPLGSKSGPPPASAAERRELSYKFVVHVPEEKLLETCGTYVPRYISVTRK